MILCNKLITYCHDFLFYLFFYFIIHEKKSFKLFLLFEIWILLPQNFFISTHEEPDCFLSPSIIMFVMSFMQQFAGYVWYIMCRSDHLRRKRFQKFLKFPKNEIVIQSQRVLIDLIRDNVYRFKSKLTCWASPHFEPKFGRTKVIVPENEREKKMQDPCRHVQAHFTSAALFYLASGHKWSYKKKYNNTTV